MKNKKFKMPSSYTILFLIIVVVAILTWIVPAGEYSKECTDGSYIYQEIDNGGICVSESQMNSASLEEYSAFEDVANTQLSDEIVGPIEGTTIDAIVPDSGDVENVYNKIDKNEQGVWQILNSPIEGFSEALGIALFVIVIGGFIGIVMETGALDAGIGSILKTFKGKEFYLIPILMVLFGLGGSTFGMAEETIAFYPLIIPIIIAAGYDVATAVMIVLLGAGVGVLGSTVNPFAIGAASDAANVSLGDGIALRLILLIAVEAFAIFYVMKYASGVKKDINNSKVKDLHDEHVKHFMKSDNTTTEKKSGHMLVLIMFALTFIVMVLSVMPWSDFGVKIFDKLNDKIGGIKFLGGNSGSVALGGWWFQELTMLFLTSSVIIGIYAKSKNLIGDKNAISVWINGSKDLLSVALIIGLSRGIKVVMSAGSMSDSLLYYGSSALEGLGNIAFVILNYIFFIPMSFLIPSTSGLAGATMPIMGPLGELVTESKAGTALVITGYSAASGIVNLITPTSGVVMGALMIAKLPYQRWLKIVLPVIIGVFIISVLVLAAGALFTL